MSGRTQPFYVYIPVRIVFVYPVVFGRRFAAAAVAVAATDIAAVGVAMDCCAYWCLSIDVVSGTRENEVSEF